LSVCIDLPNAAQIIGDWLYTWQTLISGLLALAAALLAGCLLRQQIQQTTTLSDQALARKFLAARCFLPIHLVEADDYCGRVKCALNSLTQNDLTSINENLDLASKMKFPSDSIEQMTKALEFTTSECFSKIIAWIIGELQVLHSQISSITANDDATGGNRPSNVEMHIIQAAKISTMLSRLFEYARQENDELPESIAWKDVKHRLQRWNLEQERRDRMMSYLDLNQKSGPMFSCSK
jgi:hypothetical protein